VNDILDLHTHTLASGHAYNTIMEMAAAAKDAGLQILGITEHAPQMPGSCHIYYFENLKVVPRSLYGVRLLLGTELNINDLEGHVDLPENVLKQMDICVASMHKPCIQVGSRQENTRAYRLVMENPYVTIIGHPDDGKMPVDYEELAKGAAEAHVLLELNNSSLRPGSFRLNSQENAKTMLKYCEKYGARVVMDSDAHVMTDVGNHGYCLTLVEETGFPKELVVNYSAALLEEYLKTE